MSITKEIYTHTKIHLEYACFNVGYKKKYFKIIVSNCIHVTIVYTYKHFFLLQH